MTTQIESGEIYRLSLIMRHSELLQITIKAILSGTSVFRENLTGM